MSTQLGEDEAKHIEHYEEVEEVDPYQASVRIGHINEFYGIPHDLY